LVLLSGCAAVDNFSSRALTYNRQAATIQEQALLLNVMRAAYRAPLQFTAFTQITGQAAVAGTAAFSLPFNPSPPSFPHADVASPSATLSGTEAFTVANLDTQEFYQGILSPVPLSTIDHYLEQGYPETVVLTLMVGRIDFDIRGGASGSIANNFYHSGYRHFESAILGLVDLGLRTETVTDVESIGPPLDPDQIGEVRALGPLIGPDTELRPFTPATDPDLTLAERTALAARHAGEYFRLQTTTKASRFCFDSRRRHLHAASLALIAAGILGPGETVTGFAPGLISTAEQCGAPGYLRRRAEARSGYAAPDRRLELEVADQGGAVRRISLGLIFTVRSAEGIIYHLGEIARGELEIGAHSALPPPVVMTALGEDRLFEVRHGCAEAPREISIAYGGGRYCIGVDPSGHDRSAEVMQIVLQLLALENSARNLPAAGVISILGP
ncbi:MAG: hypothetical protein ACREFT_06645, partial [Acetobacteraceae bacterium]